MDEELIVLYREKVKTLLEKAETLEPGSKERNDMVKEIETYQKLLTENLKIEQDAYDAEEDRKLKEADAEADRQMKVVEAEKQAKVDRKWKIVDTVKAILIAVIPGLIAFAGLKSNQKHVMRADQAGVYQDKNITKTDPKFKWW